MAKRDKETELEISPRAKSRANFKAKIADREDKKQEEKEKRKNAPARTPKKTFQEKKKKAEERRAEKKQQKKTQNPQKSQAQQKLDSITDENFQKRRQEAKLKRAQKTPEEQKEEKEKRYKKMREDAKVNQEDRDALNNANGKVGKMQQDNVVTSRVDGDGDLVIRLTNEKKTEHAEGKEKARGDFIPYIKDEDRGSNREYENRKAIIQNVEKATIEDLVKQHPNNKKGELQSFDINTDDGFKNAKKHLKEEHNLEVNIRRETSETSTNRSYSPIVVVSKIPQKLTKDPEPSKAQESKGVGENNTIKTDYIPQPKNPEDIVPPIPGGHYPLPPSPTIPKGNVIPPSDPKTPDKINNNTPPNSPRSNPSGEPPTPNDPPYQPLRGNTPPTAEHIPELIPTPTPPKGEIPVKMKRSESIPGKVELMDRTEGGSHFEVEINKPLTATTIRDSEPTTPKPKMQEQSPDKITKKEETQPKRRQERNLSAKSDIPTETPKTNPIKNLIKQVSQRFGGGKSVLQMAAKYTDEKIAPNSENPKAEQKNAANLREAHDKKTELNKGKDVKDQVVGNPIKGKQPNFKAEVKADTLPKISGDGVASKTAQHEQNIVNANPGKKDITKASKENINKLEKASQQVKAGGKTFAKLVKNLSQSNIKVPENQKGSSPTSVGAKPKSQNTGINM